MSNSLPVRISFLLVLAICCYPSFVYSSELRLTYSRIETVSPRSAKARAAVAPSSTKSMYTVVIGDTYFFTISGNRTQVCDFQRRRIITLHSDTKQYEDHSIYYFVASREKEFANQLTVRGLMKKVNKSKMTLFDLETFFSVENAAGDSVDLKRIEHNETVKFIADNTTAAEFQSSDSTFTSGEKKIFGNFLTYAARLHPRIRRQIVAHGKIPSLLQYTFKNNAESTFVKLSLKNISRTSTATYSIPTGYRQQYFSPDANDSILQEIGKIVGKASAHTQTVDDYATTARNALAEKNYLDLFLTRWEYGMQFCDSLPEELKKYDLPTNAQADKRYDKFLQAYASFQAGKEDSATLNIYRSIDRNRLDKSYVLDFFLSHVERTWFGVRGSRHSFLNALRGNPYLGGIILDLGGWLNDTHETKAAWDCWDIARKILPEDCKLLTPITQFEGWLEKTFPDYF